MDLPLSLEHIADVVRKRALVLHGISVVIRVIFLVLVTARGALVLDSCIQKEHTCTSIEFLVKREVQKNPDSNCFIDYILL